jgi:hypothetical protein
MRCTRRVGPGGMGLSLLPIWHVCSRSSTKSEGDRWDVSRGWSLSRVDGLYDGDLRAIGTARVSPLGRVQVTTPPTIRHRVSPTLANITLPCDEMGFFANSALSFSGPGSYG